MQLTYKPDTLRPIQSTSQYPILIIILMLLSHFRQDLPNSSLKEVSIRNFWSFSYFLHTLRVMLNRLQPLQFNYSIYNARKLNQTKFLVVNRSYSLVFSSLRSSYFISLSSLQVKQLRGNVNKCKRISWIYSALDSITCSIFLCYCNNK
jgi:hypothetical protein